MMRTVVLLGLASVSLAACGGGAGPEAAGSVAAPAPGPNTSGSVYDQFVTPTEARTYAGIGGTQQYRYSIVEAPGLEGHQKQTYAGNATTVRSSSISISYDPRDAIFNLVINDPKSGVGVNSRFQDPANRTAFGGAVQPQWGSPNFTNATATAANVALPQVQYLQGGDGDPSNYPASGSGVVNFGTPTIAPTGDHTLGSAYKAITFFFEKPGTSTKYVTLAGYLKNDLSFVQSDTGGAKVDETAYILDRGVFAYGMLTDNTAVPTSGTATYTGSTIATMVYNPDLDVTGSTTPTYFQWLQGKSSVAVDFGKASVTLDVSGVVLDPQLDGPLAVNNAHIAAGSQFAGHGTAAIDLVAKGGFTGSFDGGSFVFKDSAGTNVIATVNVAGSSIDGAFYGPKADEVGGGFRVVGGIPDQRVDILGAFTGKK